MELETKQQVFIIPFDPTCAWCLEEHGLLTPENQQEGDSHGICDGHKEQEALKFYTRRFNCVPSYVCEKEDFIKYKEKKRAKR